MSADGAARPLDPDMLLRSVTLLAELSSRFINLAPADVDREIEDALRRVCGLVGVDLAVLWQWSGAEPRVVVPTHAYCADEALRPSEPMGQDQYPWLVQQALAGRMVAVACLEDFPPEAGVDRETLRQNGVKSGVCLPLTAAGEPPIGILGLSVMREERAWPDALLRQLQLIAQVFTNALVRRRHEVSLQQSEEVNRATFDQAAVGIAHVGIDGRWLRVNDRLCAIVGYPREELLQLTFQDVTHPDDLEMDLRHVREVLSGRVPTYSVEKRYVRKDRSLVWINLTVSLLRTAAGEPRFFIAVVEDITERKRVSEALRASEARIAAGAGLAGLAFYEVDLAGRAAYVDDRLRDICGVPPECEPELRVLDFWMEHLHPDDRRRVLDLREAMHGGRIDRLSIEYRFMHPSAGERWIHHAAGAAERDPAGRATRTFGVLRDVTDRKRAESELHGLSQRLIRAQEEERALLARELHDDVTQRLAVLAIDAGRAELAAHGGAHAEVMRTLRERLVRLSEDIHALAYQLHPSVLEELGLGEALKAECERQGRRSGLDISAGVVVPRPAVSRDVALCLYRVAQEALNNVVRHAHARSASVVLRQADGGLFLAIRDDGLGFDPEGPRRTRSLGLASMRERLQFVNGTLDIESAPGSGTAVIAWVPEAGVSS